jgi:putative membrane-bound dehydrogenase-like protein
MNHLVLLVALGIAFSPSAFAGEPPTATDPAITITLLAEHPHLLTPTGVDVASDGRLYVLENNTHFRPEEYPSGRTSDRILIFEDTGGGAPSPEPKVFYEGLVWGTDLAISSTGWIYASTRMEIFRMRDTDGDGVADDIRGVIDMETDGDHPHNGISGLCFDAEGNLSFGLGENYGAPYTLIGPKGSRLTGGGEGGSTYRCRPDGSELKRISPGIWNPFGMEYDESGNLFATDNDPSSSPPCRLLHVVEGTD